MNDYKLVPTELTAEMVEASGCEGNFKVSPHEQAQEMWEAMLVAAPAVQGEPVARVKTVGGYPDESEHVVEWLRKHKDLKDGDHLYAAPQPAQEIGEVVVTKDKLGNIVSVTRQDAEGRVLPVIAESGGISLSGVLAEGYFHPLPDESDYEFHDAEQFPDGSDCPACVPAVIVRRSAVENQLAPDVAGLTEALRQYQHNDGSGLVFGYDRLLVDQYVAGLVEALVACGRASSAAEVGLIVDEALAPYRKEGE